MKQKLIALMGKSGSGKDTICKALLNKHPDKFNMIVSATTRPPREGEQDGIDYHFMGSYDFNNLLANNKLLESCIFNNWHYGTPKDSLSIEKVNIGIFTPDGIRQILKDHLDEIDLSIYYVRAGDKERLLRQLNREENPNVTEICRRFGTDEKDFYNISDIPYCLIFNSDNDSLDATIEFIKGHECLNF